MWEFKCQRKTYRWTNKTAYRPTVLDLIVFDFDGYDAS